MTKNHLRINEQTVGLKLVRLRIVRLEIVRLKTVRLKIVRLKIAVVLEGEMRVVPVTQVRATLIS